MSTLKTNLIAFGLLLAVFVGSGIGLYMVGKSAGRAEAPTEALESLQEAYKRITADFAATLEADSAAIRAYRASDTTRVVVRDRFRTLIDTLAYTDTVVVVAAEEAIQACEHTLLRCAEARAAGDSVRANLEEQVATLQGIISQQRALAEVACEGRTPTWLNGVSFVTGSAFGAWLRGKQ